MSETISCRNWLNVASRFACLTLYSEAKKVRFHTSARLPPPVSFRAPRSNEYHSPAGFAWAGVGSSTSLHRSMKCSCEAALPSNPTLARHLAMNSPGIIAA